MAPPAMEDRENLHRFILEALRQLLNDSHCPPAMSAVGDVRWVVQPAAVHHSNAKRADTLPMGRVGLNLTVYMDTAINPEAMAKATDRQSLVKMCLMALSTKIVDAGRHLDPYGFSS